MKLVHVVYHLVICIRNNCFEEDACRSLYKNLLVYEFSCKCIISSCIFDSRITVKIDDEMVKHYCNEDLFILEVKRDAHPEEEELYELTLIELPSP